MWGWMEEELLLLKNLSLDTTKIQQHPKKSIKIISNYSNYWFLYQNIIYIYIYTRRVNMI